MNILVIGSGAREHTLVWKLSQSKHADKIYAVPGNPGSLATHASTVTLVTGMYRT